MIFYYALAIFCLIGAAGCGIYTYTAQKNNPWFSGMVMGTAGHGFMLAYMGLMAPFVHMGHGMMVFGALSALPVNAKLFFDVTGISIAKD